MQRNPYWPLNGPSFFSVPRFRRCIFSRSAKVAVGFGSNFTARMASRQTKVETEVSRCLRQRRTQNMLIGATTRRVLLHTVREIRGETGG
jgi:hypothetical protein